MVPQLRYVLVTPARNEEAFIELTIRSMIAQTVLPARWAIVSDGSTDRTDEIVKKYLPDHPWMELVRLEERKERHFGGKVRSFNAGYERVRGIPYDVVGNLDADITFEPDYLEFLLRKFCEDARLGVAGTPFVEGAVSYDYRYTNIEHVSGACQLFRRECFEQIGGYVPIKGGGIDWLAVTTARMKGWKTRTFTERVCQHHRPMGTGSSTTLGACFKLGTQDYYLGGHPLWQCFRAAFQLARPPFLLGGILLFAGFFWAWIRRAERPISPEVMKYHRTEQIRRLKAILTRPFRSKAKPNP
ncbi:MAG TPA: glycosyltransferase family 2 protein [Candidatus Dormibacteraeota bacterium]|nr:glycosyltransferase family 2 protein [Verrucomicrobiae bacterium]HXJ71469.1 glycosyltransferase family 2 protein [Candidatus Dormibacteraeota bacterium]